MPVEIRAISHQNSEVKRELGKSELGKSVCSYYKTIMGQRNFLSLSTSTRINVQKKPHLLLVPSPSGVSLRVDHCLAWHGHLWHYHNYQVDNVC